MNRMHINIGNPPGEGLPKLGIKMTKIQTFLTSGVSALHKTFTHFIKSVIAFFW